MRIFLIGPRGAGKTTVGEVLAELLSLPHQDTDALLLAEAATDIDSFPENALTVIDIVAREGWAGFRQRESRSLRLAGDGIIATGGGMVLDPENRAHMRAHGTVIYLRATAEILRARLDGALGQGGNRPSLTGADPLEEIAAVLREREPLYLEAAHHVVDASLPARRVAEAIARLPLAGGAMQENVE